MVDCILDHSQQTCLVLSDKGQWKGVSETSWTQGHALKKTVSFSQLMNTKKRRRSGVEGGLYSDGDGGLSVIS